MCVYIPGVQKSIGTPEPRVSNEPPNVGDGN